MHFCASPLLSTHLVSWAFPQLTEETKILHQNLQVEGAAEAPPGSEAAMGTAWSQAPRPGHFSASARQTLLGLSAPSYWSEPCQHHLAQVPQVPCTAWFLGRGSRQRRKTDGSESSTGS